MNPSTKDGWHAASAGPGHPGVDQLGQPPPRLASYGPPYPPLGQSGHTLPALSDLTQGAAPPRPPQPPPRYGPPPGPSHQLPGFGQAIQHSPPQPPVNRDREREIRERDREMYEREEMLNRERELREREHREREMERYHHERQHGHPVQSNAGSIPIHQPVASKVSNSIHGPNGLLSNLAGGGPVPNPQSGSLHASNGPESVFGQVSHADGPARGYLPSGPPSMVGYGGAAIPQMTSSMGLSQGQQPILNDALTYLDQVKLKFSDHPDVYNRFLDIMKDFKSQAIDTPGVIQRVSTLFNGHPTLIQGFNTFLPPGYRIECGTEDNPDAIRVTTPSGTNTISMQAGAPGEPTGPPTTLHPSSRPEFYDQRPGWPQPPPQQQPTQPHLYSPKHRPMPQNIYGQQANQPHKDPFDYPKEYTQNVNNVSALVNQPDRAAGQLPPSMTAGPARTPLMASLGDSQTPVGQPMSNLAGVGSSVLQGQTDVKRGPVEFNHAINYVNKIKNRFADSPEIYKQFLEILQTYQRESKPIQDVYSQVTLLFNTAPDLLEDFKQFLPESAAHAKAVAARIDEPAAVSSLRGDYGAPSVNNQPPRGDFKMPPLGQFNVKESTENKKRRPGPQIGPPVASSTMVDGVAAGNQANRPSSVQMGNVNKRTKLNHKPAQQQEAPPAMSPTLIPALPEPIPPTVSTTPSHEEYAFFDRVRKYISNRQTFNEFIKLCNLYSADLIDRNVLVNRAGGFIGANQDLMSWFKRFMHAEPKDEVIEPKAKPDTGVVDLSHCRAFGPSYRLLPKRERQKPCSGRDELCQSVLNDEWASHPTWASEDSGFVAHRKNQYEDSLHRIEEDRHDYDHHIEGCVRTIQLMEPLVQQIAGISDIERASFRLPPGLGGQSETIYRRVIKKIYGREQGQKVIDEMFARPCTVLPVVLSRLKQKCEEWRASQREWDKVWREQTQKAFWRSLDHQAITAKGADKKLFVGKHIQAEIQAKLEEARNVRKTGYHVPSYQFDFAFEDPEVILDATHLLITHVDHSSAGFGADPAKVMSFLKDFVPVFFGLDRSAFKACLNECYASGASPNSEIDDDSVPEDPPASSARKMPSSRKDDLLRSVLRPKNEKPPRIEKDDRSRASTPSLVPSTSAPDPTQPVDVVAQLRWMEHPSQGNFNSTHKREFPLSQPYKRKVFHLYCNAPVYFFIRSFEILYSRLLKVKMHEKSAHEAVRRASAPKAAYSLGMIDKAPSELLYDTDPKANFYHQIVRMCDEVVRGQMEGSHFEETLRRYYLSVGWQLYNLDKILSGIARFTGGIFDPRDRSSDIINLFFKERAKEETTHNVEIQYRKQVEKLIREGDLYRITFIPAMRHVTVQLMTAEDSTLDSDDLGAEARWSYYVSAYTMCDPTEGVPFSQMRMPFLQRSLPPRPEAVAAGASPQALEEEYSRYYRPIISNDGLVLRICASSYHILYVPNTGEWWYRTPVSLPAAEARDIAAEYANTRRRRRERFAEKFGVRPMWARQDGAAAKTDGEVNGERDGAVNGDMEAEGESEAIGDGDPEAEIRRRQLANTDINEANQHFREWAGEPEVQTMHAEVTKPEAAEQEPMSVASEAGKGKDKEIGVEDQPVDNEPATNDDVGTAQDGAAEPQQEPVRTEPDPGSVNDKEKQDRGEESDKDQQEKTEPKDDEKKEDVPEPEQEPQPQIRQESEPRARSEGRIQTAKGDEMTDAA